MSNPASLPARRPAQGLRLCGRAFSLVEMMVAVLVLSILIILLCGILNQVSTGFTQVFAQVNRRQNGLAILNQIASELRIAALPADRWNNRDLQLLVDPINFIA